MLIECEEAVSCDAAFFEFAENNGLLSYSEGRTMNEYEMGIPIKAYSKQGLEQVICNLGQPMFRVKQLYDWIYCKHVSDYDEMTNLPAKLRNDLKTNAPLYCAEIVERRVSRDGTRKYIVRFHDDNTTEMVAIPSDGRLTVCFSTQIGCPMQCSFCATGKEGFIRNLLPGEMIDQIVLAERDMGMRVSNVVAMGQGEPFLNYENVLSALRIMNDQAALGIGARHITVSTCGLIDGIEDWSKEPEQFTLAVSLHSAIQKTRNELMPRVANQSLEKLQNALVDYTLSTKRRVTLEYIMIEGVNDDDEHLDALRDFCAGMLCHVNLIPINSVDDSSLSPAPQRIMQKFVVVMQKAGIETTIRNSKGQDIDGACGQLKNQLMGTQ